MQITIRNNYGVELERLQWVLSARHCDDGVLMLSGVLFDGELAICTDRDRMHVAHMPMIAGRLISSPSGRCFCRVLKARKSYVDLETDQDVTFLDWLAVVPASLDEHVNMEEDKHAIWTWTKLVRDLIPWNCTLDYAFLGDALDQPGKSTLYAAPYEKKNWMHPVVVASEGCAALIMPMRD